MRVTYPKEKKGQKRAKKAKKDEALNGEHVRVSAVVREFPNGRRLVREATNKAQRVDVPGYGYYALAPATYSFGDRSWSGWDWDLSGIEPPPGAVLADPQLQNCSFFSRPILWYSDIGQVCMQCQEDFIFSAKEQKFWYETLGFYMDSHAVRCVACRKKRRSITSLHRELGAALRGVEGEPKEAGRWLELARVCAELRVRSDEGDINRGIGAARKAWRLSQEQLPEALYWESLLQRAAKREKQAIALEDTFMERSSDTRPYWAMREAIRRRRTGKAR